MRYLAVCILVLVITACRQASPKIIKNDSIAAVKATLSTVAKKDTFVKKVYPLTDSGQLMMHLDSLPKVTFPYKADGQYEPSYAIDLSIFKNKKNIHIPLKLIPTQLGGGLLDDNEFHDTTFNLIDSVTYKAEWKLIATKPKFVVIENGSVLVTLAYNFDVIDAIHTAAGEGNNHWNIERTSTINKDLTIVLHHSWSVETYKKGHFEYEYADENWFIDDGGHIRKQPFKSKSKKHK